MTPDDFLSRVVPLRDRILRFASSLVGRGEGEDVAQQVLTRLWERRGELERVQSLSALSITMARNACIDRMRRRRTADAALADGDLERPTLHPERALEASDRFRRVLRLVRRLPPRQRRALVMRDLAECSYQEIARALDSTPTNARMQVCRARQALRRFYEEAYDESPRSA
jgi:RNA polymerase sigma-70 factor (ECF subfamily)